MNQNLNLTALVKVAMDLQGCERRALPAAAKGKRIGGGGAVQQRRSSSDVDADIAAVQAQLSENAEALRRVGEQIAGS